MLNGKTIILGVTGSIAAYKAANLASLLKKNHADVHVIMTKNACNIINPITFETLTGNKCLVDTFDRNFQFDVQHISLAKKASCFLTGPASANFIAKAACGIADDMLTTTWLAFSGKKIVSPAMNTAMFENPVTQENIQRLKKFGVEIVEPASGYLACGDSGKGKFPEADVLFEYILNAVTEKDLAGKKILVTAGPTREKLDPVRFLTNHSSGKMGYAIARAASYRGAEVTLVSGPVASDLKVPLNVELLKIESAKDMFDAVSANFSGKDLIIKAAAVADFTPAVFSDEKIKKEAMKKADSPKAEGSETQKSAGENENYAIALKKTTDILAFLGANKEKNQKLCGFAMETENVLENARKKLLKKNLDMICANSIKTEGAGFQGDTNVITMIKKDKEIELPKMSKFDAANRILDEIFKN